MDDATYNPIASDAESIKTVATEELLPEDLARIAANIAALVDPTGIAGTVAAFTYPTCSDIFGTYSAGISQQYEQHNVQEVERRFENELRQKPYSEQQKLLEDLTQERKRRFSWVKARSSKVGHQKKHHRKDSSKTDL